MSRINPNRRRVELAVCACLLQGILSQVALARMLLFPNDPICRNMTP
jgi:hypothetical protein